MITFELKDVFIPEYGSHVDKKVPLGDKLREVNLLFSTSKQFWKLPVLETLTL